MHPEPLPTQRGPAERAAVNGTAISGDRSLSHEDLLTLARKTEMAARDGDLTRLVRPSTPAAPRFARTRFHASHRTSVL